MNVTLRMITLIFLFILTSCKGDIATLGSIDDEPNSGVLGGIHPDRNADTVDTKTIKEKLGVNFTWAADQRITGDPTFVGNAFTHVRYFQMMEKDYGSGTPADTDLEVCTDLANPWSCSSKSMRNHLIRVKSFRSMFPQGIIWIAPEVLKGRSWPCKSWNVQEMGGDPREAGYKWAKVALATYGQVGNIVIAMTNEEWCAGAERAQAYNEWRRGIIQAHRENPSCVIAVGARHIRPKMWQGQRLNDNVNDVAPDVWAYIDSIGGYADYHAHGIVNNQFLSHQNADKAGDYKDYFAWSSWLDEQYPNIKKAVGEIAYTTSPSNVVATPTQKLADWPTYRKLIEGVAEKSDLVFLYQIEDHQSPEGAFSGSGVYPTLIPKIEEMCAQRKP